MVETVAGKGTETEETKEAVTTEAVTVMVIMEVVLSTVEDKVNLDLPQVRRLLAWTGGRGNKECY